PTATINGWQPEYVAQKSVISFRVRAIDDRMCTDDHDCLSLCKVAQLLSELPVGGDKSRSAYLREAALRIKHEFGRNILHLSFCLANGDIRLPLPAQRCGAKDSTQPLGDDVDVRRQGTLHVQSRWPVQLPRAKAQGRARGRSARASGPRRRPPEAVI